MKQDGYYQRCIIQSGNKPNVWVRLLNRFLESIRGIYIAVALMIFIIDIAFCAARVIPT
jgi:hypothetical protein